MDLNLLRSFQAVAERGSVSGATHVLHLSQPAVSLQIKRLEDHFGKKLFERRSQGLRLTQFGKDLLVHARKLSELGDAIARLGESRPSHPHGVLRIGTYTTISSYLIADVATKFGEAYPGVSLQYQYDTVEILLDRIRNQEIEGAILSDVPERSSFRTVPLFTDELVYVVSSRAKFDVPDAIPAAKLAEIPFLAYSLRYDLCYRQVESSYGKHLATTRIPVECTSFDTLKQMLLRGAGASFMPRYLVRAEIEKGLLREIRVGKQKLPVRFSFVSLGEDSLSVTTREFRDRLIRHFGGDAAPGRDSPRA